MPSVSVLLPSFNAAATLSEALESLAEQTFTDFEVVLVDDGSTDDSLAIARAWVGMDRRFRLISESHHGIIHALNAGLQACQAPCVARMDADDRSHPERTRPPGCLPGCTQMWQW
jgi:glycosyltransferase involved in cell wall biosynthesis